MQNFEEIVRQWGPMVYRLALATLRHKADAEDVFQEVFLRCSRQRGFQSEEHLRAWLLRVTINQCRNLRRSAWFRHRAALPDNLPEVPAPASSCSLQDALSQLPDKYRAIIHLYYYENYRTDEIAALMHMPPATVRTRLARARKQLSDLLKGDFADDFS